MNRGCPCNGIGVFVLLLSLVTLGCTRASAPLDLSSSDPSHDQWKIASNYAREAALFRSKAEELADRVAVYERLFGPDSEWVTGAKLLIEYYRNAAEERERLADMHLELTADGRRSRVAAPASR
ncbi:MAG TPA: hypothetical protein VNK46_10870 [Nitrospiraceae bacterium]|jgi:hypothetical protein|nr:hypothetical protein [Nitrospiraceae bacterium]